MGSFLNIGAAAGLLASLAPLGAWAQCNLSLASEGVGGSRVYASSAGPPAVYFRAKMAVNTDGSSRSYHPQDPRGQTLALNNMGNAITAIYDAQEQRIDCRPRVRDCYRRYIETFEAARDAQWNPVGHPRVETKGIIPWRHDPALNRRVPCLIPAGPSAGYFVSQTSALADAARGACDQGRYLDSLAINSIVLPKNTSWASQGSVANEYDLVAVRDRASGRVAYAIVGDRGPANTVGEGSIALTAALSGQQLNGRETYQEIRRLHRRDVDYVVFPNRDIRQIEPGPITAEKVDRLGREAFERWGGADRLDACRAEIGGG